MTWVVCCVKMEQEASRLIIDSIIILFDARGSWLQYNIGDQKHILIKGDCEIPSDTAIKNDDNSIIVEIKSPVIQGLLGNFVPEDTDRAAAFMQFMVQECTIAFEIENLIKLMESRLNLVLGAIESLVLLIDRHMNICFANKSAEELLSQSTAELLGLPATKITAPWNEWIIASSNKAVKGIKDQLKNISGTRYVDWNIYPLTGDDITSGWLVIADDRTDFYRLQEIGEQAERMVNTSTLLGILAHEIRN
jgi:transcriptional regulator with PAS, ATPase and Fis domain